MRCFLFGSRPRTENLGGDSIVTGFVKLMFDKVSHSTRSRMKQPQATVSAACDKVSKSLPLAHKS